VLVDCDFIGRALSHQFKHLHSPGVCEVLRRGSLGSEVVRIEENLSLLPVGADLAFSASNLQIGSLRRLIRTLRDQFDVIIVDSGPVTASVEAIPVASSCDGAVMVIRRGRSRSRLPESVKELTDTGIDYLGLVLNYADADDCRRYGSISKMSVEVARALAESSAPATPHPLLGAGRGGASA
jgi:Mrp family chromosome partitioning ATPase